MAVHGASGRHSRTEPVTEIFRDETAWKGEVEIFDLADHPKAKRCYAWGYDDAGTFRVTAVLEIPPVESPEMAVRVAIAAQARKTA